MSWRLLTHDGVGAAEGLAGDEALMQRYGRGEHAEAEAALRLYTYRNAALVGRYQVLEEELDLPACRALGLEYGRRPTGGGAILMGADQLGVAVATRAPADTAPRELLRRYAEGVVAGLQRFGIDARFRNKNDLEVGGRKIAGLGLYLDDHGGLLFHASVLAHLDVPLMLRVLRIPGAKLSDKAVKRVGERITTVSRELRQSTAAADLRGAIRDGFAEALGVELSASGFHDDELRRAAELETTRYGSVEWLRQRTPLRDARGSAVLKTPEGLVRIFVGVHGTTIKNTLLAGDFNVLPEGVTKLEAMLRWSPATRERVDEVTAEALDEAELGVPPQTVAGAIWEATARALERRVAHPVRADGSCYFPDPGEPAPTPLAAVAGEPS